MLNFLMITENLSSQEKPKFEELYYKYRNALFFAAFNILKNREDAEDVLQNAFIKISQNMKSIEDLESRKTLSYLLVITRNTAYDYIRKNYRSEEVSIDEIGEKLDYDSEIEKITSNIDYKNIVKAIKSIASPYKEVLYFHYVMDYSISKTAKLLGRKKPTVKMQLVRGKKVLLTKLSEVQYE